MLVAGEGYTTVSLKAKIMFLQMTGHSKHSLANPAMLAIFKELGSEEFTSKEYPGKLQLVKVPKPHGPLHITHCNELNCDYICEEHLVWRPSFGHAGKGHEPSKDKFRALAVNGMVGNGFLLSDKALKLYLTLSSSKTKAGALLYSHDEIKHGVLPRDDPLLVAVVKKLKGEVNGFCANIKIVHIPLTVTKWKIMKDQGCEWVAEEHRQWWPELS